MKLQIRQPVGRVCPNLTGDVRIVQSLLNRHVSKLAPMRPLAVDGRMGPATLTAIEVFQRKVARLSHPDGRIVPMGITWRHLTTNAGNLPTTSSDPAAPNIPIDLPGARTNEAALKIIKEQEGDPTSKPPYGPYLNAYVCPAGKLTIGWGHTGADVTAGKTIRAADADMLLKTDLARFEDGVRRMVTVPVSANQFSALVSFAFNLGLANLESSTLMTKLNQSDYSGAADEFPKWVFATVKGAKQKLAGLEKRRQRERELFLLR